jgi:hypothetical protein
MARDPVIKIEPINAAVAAQMLGTSAGNRSLRKSAINRYARDMAGGKWVLNGEGLKFDSSGRLIDGHHRLHAVIAAQTTVTFLVVRNVPQDAMLTLDTGVSRSFWDASVVAGKNYHRKTGPIARWWYRYQGDRVTGFGPQASHQELEAIVLAHPGILESASFIGRLKTINKYCVPSVQGFVHAYASEKYDRELADVFLNEGAKLDEHSPVFVLRRLLVEDERRVEPYRVLAYSIKAWNAWLAGDKLRLLSWRNAGPSPEAFPRFEADAPQGSKDFKRSRDRAKAQIALIQQHGPQPRRRPAGRTA